MGDGFGTGLNFRVEDATSGPQQSGRISTIRNGSDTSHDMLFETVVPQGPTKKKLRRVDGTLKIVRKRKKPLPLSMRAIGKAAAHRRARKSALARKSTQRKITKKAVKTTKKGRARGLYK